LLPGTPHDYISTFLNRFKYGFDLRFLLAFSRHFQPHPLVLWRLVRFASPFARCCHQVPHLLKLRPHLSIRTARSSLVLQLSISKAIFLSGLLILVEINCVLEVVMSHFDCYNISIYRYDTLIFAAGSVANTFGLPGVHENAMFLKCASDAMCVPLVFSSLLFDMIAWFEFFLSTPSHPFNPLIISRIRARVHDLFEGASLPGVSEADARQMLRMVICGGGPTGAELAAELRDLIDADLRRLYPRLAPLAEV
jgi:hypothetical protein